MLCVWIAGTCSLSPVEEGGERSSVLCSLPHTGGMRLALGWWFNPAWSMHWAPMLLQLSCAYEELQRKEGVVPGGLPAQLVRRALNCPVGERGCLAPASFPTKFSPFPYSAQGTCTYGRG